MTKDTPASSVPVKSANHEKWGGGAIAAAVLGVALVGGNIYLLNRTNTLESKMEDMRGAVKTEIANLQQLEDAAASQNSKLIDALEAKVKETGSLSAKAMTQAVAQANLSAKRVSADFRKKMEEEQQAQIERHQALTAQLGELKDDATNTSTKVTGIETEVTGVKTDVAQTKTDIEKTFGDLKSVRGDLGVQSGLVATNSKEIAALRALGERDIVEFQLTKTKAPQKIGDVAVQLKKSDARRNRYTIELIANDKRVEKKDRSVNEPVQFYMASARIPYELVVNEVRGDKIVGYLAEPKVRNAR